MLLDDDCGFPRCYCEAWNRFFWGAPKVLFLPTAFDSFAIVLGLVKIDLNPKRTLWLV